MGSCEEPLPSISPQKDKKGKEEGKQAAEGKAKKEKKVADSKAADGKESGEYQTPVCAT